MPKSERKDLEAAMLSAVVNTAVDAIITIDQDGIIKAANPACERLFGYAVEELLGQNVRILMPSPHRQEHDRYLSDYLRTGIKKIIGIGREVEVRRKNGTMFPADLAISEVRFETQRLFTGVIRDLTERRQAQRSAIEMEAILKTSEDAIIETDSQGHISKWSPGAEKLFGYSAGEAAGRHLQLIVPSDRIHELTSNLEKVLNDRQPEPFETYRLHKNGKPVEVWVKTLSRTDAAGRRMGVTFIIRDLTRNKEIDQLLKRSQEHFLAFMNNSPALAYMKDLNGRFQFVNREFERVFRQPLAHFYMKTAAEVWSEETARQLRENDEKVFASNHACEFHESIPTPDGQPHEWLTFKFPLKGPDGKTILGGVAFDITERNRLQKALVEQASLARLGELAAMMAHEIKNPLAGIAGALRIIQDKMGAGSQDGAILGEVLSRLESLTKFTDDVLLFSRPKKLLLQSFPVRFLLEDCTSLLASDPLFKGIRMEIAGPRVVLSSDADLLKQVFLNFLVNSAQAMQGQGKISLHVSVEAGYCRIAIEDNGPGIPQEMVAKIFEPFFTTKPQGSGLGLAIAKRVIELHGGKISISCPPEGGTVVIVHLPMQMAPSDDSSDAS